MPGTVGEYYEEGKGCSQIRGQAEEGFTRAERTPEAVHGRQARARKASVGMHCKGRASAYGDQGDGMEDCEGRCSELS